VIDCFYSGSAQVAISMWDEQRPLFEMPHCSVWYLGGAPSPHVGSIYEI